MWLPYEDHFVALVYGVNNVPTPPKPGEKVADRPDEGEASFMAACKQNPKLRPLLQFVRVHADILDHAKSANKSREMGQRGAVQLGSEYFPGSFSGRQVSRCHSL